jgi:hypothetical protein
MSWSAQSFNKDVCLLGCCAVLSFTDVSKVLAVSIIWAIVLMMEDRRQPFSYSLP